MGLSKCDLTVLAFECLNVVFAQLLNEYRRRDMRIRCSWGNVVSTKRTKQVLPQSKRAADLHAHKPRETWQEVEKHDLITYVSNHDAHPSMDSSECVDMAPPGVPQRNDRTFDHNFKTLDFKTLDFVNCCKLLLLHILNFNMICFWSDVYEGKWDFHFKVYKNKV